MPLRPRGRRGPALALRSVPGRRPRLRPVRQPPVRGAMRGGRRPARDRSPPPARRERAVARRVTRLGTPLSAPAGGGTEPGRRSPAVRRRSQEPTRPGRRRAVRPPATAAGRPPAGPLPPAGSVAASPRASRRRAVDTAPQRDLGDRPARGGAKPPARSPGLIPCDSSTSANGLPPVSAMIRSRTRSSSRPGTALDSRARASRSSRPSSDSCGRPSSARVVAGSRSENIIATGSASKRRATNPSVCTDAASTHCASSTRHRSGPLLGGSSQSRLSTATATRNLSGTSPDAMPKATSECILLRFGSASSPPRIGAHNRWIAANGNSISAWTPSTSCDATGPRPAAPRTAAAWSFRCPARRGSPARRSDHRGPERACRRAGGTRLVRPKKPHPGW